MKIYITFGQCHNHNISGQTFNHRCIAEIECSTYAKGRATAFALFGDKFCTSHTEPPPLAHFPRGIIPAIPQQTASLVGRPRKLIDPKRCHLLLEPQDIAIAKALGNGNITKGVRKALAQANPNMNESG